MLVKDRPTLHTPASRSSMLLTVSKILAPVPNGAALRHFLSLIRRHHELVWEMTRREMLERYTGQVLGSLWALGLPLLTMGIYVFAFLVLFRGRLPGSSSSLGYAVFVLAGLAPWMAVQEALGRGPTAISGNANLVKQIVFPNEILPLRVALGVLPTLGIGVVVVATLAPIGGLGGWFMVPLLLVVVACHLVMTAGLVYALAGVGVFVRDVRDVVTVLLSVGMFLQPIFYGPGVAPRPLEVIFYMSPVSYLIWCYRDALVYGEVTRPVVWLVTPVISVLLFLAGYRLYRSLQPAFGNAL
jgi:homopolymeric O-antigen transport system permease protein